MPVPMRFRTDSAHIAELKRQGKTLEESTFGGWPTLEEWNAVPPAAPGDTWRTRWYKAGTEEGPIAGYAIACSRCLETHRWTSALNCEPKIPWSVSWVDDQGVTQTSSGTHCQHSGVGSCWIWTGSAEANTLHASPSLHALKEKGACGYHGFLQNGVLSDG